ncbi:MAG: hypothetical protein KAT31_00300 [Bacteroidales bacterium]|nr:hypothetical protein [Bacteroidales bacterium]
MSADTRWAKAAVVGGLWASFEIVIGSFLHNMHIPFSGSFLTFIATIFLISFYQLWPERGLVWRAGLICALMKSISPSAIILGPMTGIFLEALLIDLFLRMIGNNPAGYLLAGIAGQLSALLHKIGSLLILYGLDIVNIYENMFTFTMRQFKNIDISPLQALFFLILIYIAAGILAAVIATYIGKSTSRERNYPNMPERKNLKETDWEVLAPGQTFQLPLMVLHLLLLPVFLYAFNKVGLHPLIIGVLMVYIIFCLAWYKRIKYRLMKPFFWIHLIIIAVLAGIFWKAPDTAAETVSGSGRWDGWIIGLSLNLRVVLVVTGFSALSTELRNPRLKSFLFKFGFSKIYAALSMAFSALPLMMERGVTGKAFLANPIRAIRYMLADANEWLYVLQQNK